MFPEYDRYVKTLKFHASPAKAPAPRVRYGVFTPRDAQATAVVMMGTGEAIEKYHLTCFELFRRGLQVFIAERPGNGLSDRPLSGPKRQRDHFTTMKPFIEHQHRIYEDLVLPHSNGRDLYLFGFSRGAHEGVRWMKEYGQRHIKKAVLVAPMMAIRPVSAPAKALCSVMARLSPTRYALGERDWSEDKYAFETNPNTSNRVLFERAKRQLTRNPELQTGGFTWAAVNAIFASLAVIESPGYLEDIKIPVLSIIGTQDKTTPTVAVQRQVTRFPNGRVEIIEGARHQLLHEAKPVQREAWKHIDRFLFPTHAP
jgi:lysophospholipase